MAFAARTPEEDFNAILSSMSAHLASSPQPPSDPSPLPNHHRNRSSSSSSHPSIHAPAPTSFQQQLFSTSSPYLPQQQQQQSAQNGGGWEGEDSYNDFSFDLSGSGAGVGGEEGNGIQLNQGDYSSSTNSYGHSFEGEAYTDSSLLGGGANGNYGGGGGGQASSSSSSSFSFNQPQHDFSSYLPSSSTSNQQQDQQQQQAWMVPQQQPSQPTSSSSNTFDFSSQPLPQFNFITTNPPSPAPDPWANPSLLHRSAHSHSPAHSFDGNDHHSSRSRASSVAGSSRGGGPSSYEGGGGGGGGGDPAEGSVNGGNFDFSQSSPAAMDEAMRGLTFEDLALIASAGGSPIPPSFNLPPSPDPQQQLYDHPSSPHNPPTVNSHASSSPSYAGSHHNSPFPHHINPSPPSFNIAYSPASNPASPSPPAHGGSSKSPPSLIIPPDPTEASIVSPQTELKPSSASSLFPPVDPRMVGVMRLATEGGGAGGPQINIVPSTPTSGQLAGQIFSEHLAELNRRHQEQQQQQSTAHPLPHQSPSSHPQPPLHSLDTASPHASFGYPSPSNGFPIHQQQQQAPSSSSQDPSHPAQQFTTSQAQFVAMMSMQMAQQQLANQQMAQFQQQQATGGGAAPSTPQAWMARLAQMNQWQGGVAQQQQQPYASTQQQEQLQQHQFPHLQRHQQPPSSYQPYTFNQPQHHQQQQPSQHQFSNPSYQYQPSQPSTSNLPRQLKAPPVRQRSRSEASLIPYDFGPPVPQAPTMDPSLLPGSRHDPNSSFFPPLSSPNTTFTFSADPASLSDDGSGSHQGSLPSPSTFSFPFFMAPVRQPTGDDGMVGGEESGTGGFGVGDGGGGGGGGEVGHPRQASFGQRAFGPGTPEYGRGLLNPWGRGGGGEEGDDGGIGGSGVGVRRSLSDAGGRRKGHRKAKSAEVTASQPDFLRSITRSDGTLGVPSPHSPSRSNHSQQHLQAPSPSWSASSPELSPSSRSRSRSPTPDILALDPDEVGSQGGGAGGSDGGGSVTSNMSVVSKHSVTTKKTAAASQGRRKVAAQFVCPIPGCGSTFTRSFNLKGHLRSHTDERPFKCETCGKSFARQHDCKRHMALHVGYRPHTCLGCQRKFARLDALARHLKSEAGQECIRSGLQPPVDEPEDQGGGGGSSTSGGGAGASSSVGKGKKKGRGVLL